ncbi:MAG: hypothetical protein AB2A00_21070 [Myxococcota bacterium]
MPASAGAALGAYATTHVVAFTIWGLLALPVLALSVSQAGSGDPMGWGALLCLMTPLQAVLVMLAAVAGSALATAAAWLTNGVVGRRTTDPLLACWLGNVPTGLAFVATVVLQGALQLAGCVGAVWAVGFMTTYLVEEQGWKQVNAEYYAVRRVGPPVFYGSWFFSQGCVLGVMLLGNLLSATLMGAAVALGGRALQPGEPPWTLDNPLPELEPEAPPPADADEETRVELDEDFYTDAP